MAAEDWVQDYWDENHYFDEEPWLPSKDIVCMYCNRDGFHWGMGPGGWRLFNDRNELHSCRKKQSQPTTQRRTRMGLFNRKPIYISDRGDEFQVEDMEPTHLLNAINHHRTQIDTIDWILEQTGGTDAQKNQFLHLRRISLHNTVEALVRELRTRDPDLDHEELS